MRQVDPKDWQRDIDRADSRIAERRVTERRRRDRWGRYVERGALLALVVLYIIGFVSADNQRDGLRATALTAKRAADQARRVNVTQAQLRAEQKNSCERVNILRAQSNRSDSVSFTILSVSAQRERALALIGPPALRELHHRSAALLAHEATRLSVTAPTRCDSHTLNGRYRYPRAQPIGDPYTGRLSSSVRRVLRASDRLLAQKSVRLPG